MRLWRILKLILVKLISDYTNNMYNFILVMLLTSELGKRYFRKIKYHFMLNHPDDEEHVDFDELMVSLKQLLDKEMDRVGNFLAPKLIKNAELAHLIGEFLTKYVIEDAQQQSRRRRASNVIGQVVGQLSGGSVGQEAFLEGICDTLERYWECRDMLRNSTEEEQSKVSQK